MATNGYQRVEAGRVRENEMPFFKENKIATPAGVFSLKNVGGKKQPTIDKEYLETENKGKNTDRDIPVVSAYNSNKVNTGM